MQIFNWKLFLTTIFLNARNPILPPQNTSSTNYLIILPLRIILSTWGIVLSVANHSYRMTNQSSCVANHFSYMTNHFSVVTNHVSHITNHFSPVTNLFCHITNHFSPWQIIFPHDEPFSRMTNHFSFVRNHFSCVGNHFPAWRIIFSYHAVDCTVLVRKERLEQFKKLYLHQN